jgi:hypothetical protein
VADVSRGPSLDSPPPLCKLQKKRITMADTSLNTGMLLKHHDITYARLVINSFLLHTHYDVRPHLFSNSVVSVHGSCHVAPTLEFLRTTILYSSNTSKVVPVFNEALSHENIWGSEGIAQPFSISASGVEKEI